MREEEDEKGVTKREQRGIDKYEDVRNSCQFPVATQHFTGDTESMNELFVRIVYLRVKSRDLLHSKS
jgi:hypothetical protein